MVVNQGIPLCIGALVFICLATQGQHLELVPMKAADAAFIRDYSDWNDSRGYQARRDRHLDERATQRCLYYLSLLVNKKGWTFRQVIDSIPRDKQAHTRQFGRPAFFEEVPGIEYTPLRDKIGGSEIVVKSEVMCQVTYKMFLSVKIPRDTLPDYLHSKLDAHYGGQLLLNAYLKSPPHRYVMEKWGHQLFGSCTMLVIRKPDMKRSGPAELLMYNLTVFGE